MKHLFFDTSSTYEDVAFSSLHERGDSETRFALEEVRAWMLKTLEDSSGISCASGGITDALEGHLSSALAKNSKGRPYGKHLDQIATLEVHLATRMGVTPPHVARVSVGTNDLLRELPELLDAFRAECIAVETHEE